MAVSPVRGRGRVAGSTVVWWGMRAAGNGLAQRACGMESSSEVGGAGNVRKRRDEGASTSAWANMTRSCSAVWCMRNDRSSMYVLHKTGLRVPGREACGVTKEPLAVGELNNPARGHE
jgi:hypothetical protein